MAAHVLLGSEASRLARKGQPWFFADDLLRNSGAGEPGIVRVVSDRGDDFGLGFFSTGPSRIRLRRCGAWPGEDLPDADKFFAARLAAAVAVREGDCDLVEDVGDHGAGPSGLRLVHGDADWLPGLVVDRYDRCLVLQSTSVVVEKHLSSIVPFLRERVGAVSVLARNDVPVRRREGLPSEVRLLDGKKVEETWIQERGVRHRIRLWTGQKTGFFLDQRPARRRVMELSAGRDVLDLCAYQGGFSLAALRGGASRATAVDVAKDALEKARLAASDNGLDGLTTECGDVFEWLRRARKDERRFDLIVLDPPAFAKSRAEVEGAIRGYRDLNRLALRILAPGGFLLTCSCSHHVRPVAFEDTLRQAAAELPFPVWLRERIAAGADHPVALNIPESEYLKVVLLQRAPDPQKDSLAREPESVRKPEPAREPGGER